MRYALINPPWSFEGSIYFGCKQPHLPLEYGYSKALLEAGGHDVEIIDAQLDNLTLESIRRRVLDFRPDFTVITTAPSYLFWRCAPPELRIPQITIRHIQDIAGTLVAVGPHASTTPVATLKKLSVDVVVMGECEEILPKLASTKREQWEEIASLCFWQDDTPRVRQAPHASDMASLPPLRWTPETLHRHAHHHHRFDAEPEGPGAELEVTRGCPYHCTFCAKENFRDAYRRRPLATVLEELDLLLEAGVEYVYFIDEIFLPNKPLLEALDARKLKFGIQTRIDLWKPDMLDLLGRAGCVSIEAGVESITPEGRDLLDKQCKLSSDELTERLVYAKERVPFVQANLLESDSDTPEAIEAWREHVQRFGVWANKPVPLFPYPGSPEYTRKWNLPDEKAWERALQYYLETYSQFSDVQEERPLPLEQLELSPQP